MCIRDSNSRNERTVTTDDSEVPVFVIPANEELVIARDTATVSYTHLRAHETVLDLVCRLLLEKKKHKIPESYLSDHITNKKDDRNISMQSTSSRRYTTHKQT